MTEIRVSQAIVEVLIDSDDRNARISQNTVEALADSDDRNARVSQANVEALADSDDRNARVSQLIVEVLWRRPDPIPPSPTVRPATVAGGSGAQSRALSLSVYQPLAIGGAWVSDYTDEVTAYGHELGADNWYNSADFTLTLPDIALDEWLIYGLGRHVEIKAPGQYVIWEGFINQLTINFGQNVYEIGPLMDIGNRVYVIYTPVYISASNGSIVKGTSMESPLVDNTASQAQYGIVEKSLSTGECAVTTAQNEAHRFRDDFLIENSYHKVGARYSFGDSGEPTIQASCLGYWKWLEAYVYNNRATAAANGYSTLDTKLQAVLTANPNPWALSTDYTRIAANTAIAANREKDNRTAYTVIKALAAAGDPSGNRWLFGVGRDRIPYYHPISTTIDYEYRTNENEQRLVVYGTDTIVEPWDVQPGKWFISSDAYRPINIPGANYPVPSAAYIETVRYSAPYGLELTEGKLSRVSQLLNLKGLGAI